MNEIQKTTLLTSDTIEDIMLTVGIDKIMDEVITRLEGALKFFNSQTTEIKQRSGFHHEDPAPGVLEWMPIRQSNQHVTIKIVGYNPKNPSLYNYPTIVSTIGRFNLSTGHLIAFSDGILPTAIRTGAASAVASKYLAKADSNILGLVGCGAQAVTQLHALSRIFNFDKIFIYDIDETTEQSFEQRSGFIDLPIIRAGLDTLEQNSDIICTATSVSPDFKPVISGKNVKEHLHINAVGSDLPGKIEIPKRLLKNCTIVPDFLKQAKVEGECQQFPEKDFTEISNIIKRSENYQHLRNKNTVFDSTGYALEDDIILDVILKHSKSVRNKIEIEIEGSNLDAKNPYGFLFQNVITQSL